MMRRFTLSAIVVGLVAFGATAATAADTYSGGCTYQAAHSPGVNPPGEFVGSLYGSIAARDDATQDPLPIRALCWVQVDGIVGADTLLEFTGTGVATGLMNFSFHAEANQVVELCWDIEYGSSRATGCSTSPLPPPPPVSAAVVGYVEIVDLGSGPTYTAHGVLADPALWMCSDNGLGTPYQVTCLPTPGSGVPWRCDHLLVSAITLTTGAVARTSVDCDGGTPEAQTSTATGPADVERVHVPSGVLAPAFVCTVDDGAGGAAVPMYLAHCADPGAVSVG